jgi:hypothetical protein
MLTILFLLAALNLGASGAICYYLWGNHAKLAGAISTFAAKLKIDGNLVGK